MRILCLIILSQRPEVCRSRLTKRPGRSAAAGTGGLSLIRSARGETAECRLMLGVDDNGSLTVDGEGIFIPGEGKYHGGSYREKV